MASTVISPQFTTNLDLLTFIALCVAYVQQLHSFFVVVNIYCIIKRLTLR